MHWIWPPGRCQNCQSIYSSSLNDDAPNIKQIHRSNDGRFVLNDDAVDGVLVESKRNSIGSQYSSSDDGGFLPKRSRISCPTWRRPLVQWPSELSVNSTRWIDLGRNLLQTIPQLHRAPTSLPNSVPFTENLHINTISANVPMISNNPYTPSRLSRIHASSPATSSPMVNSPWSPLYFSDLSSVNPSSAERSFPQQQNIFSPHHNRSLRNSRNPRYINELPALRALHEETRRMTQGFIPVQIPSPPVRSYYANIGPQFYQPSSNLHNHPISSYRSGRSRTLPRSYNRMLRAPPELASPLLNLNLNILEQSPESQSSSSGFGSKNTSSHQNQSSQSGGTAHDWRLPPYRSPPQPTTASSLPHPSQYSYYHDSLVNSPSSIHSMSHWFELMQRLNLASTNEFKAVDVGSVDGHYEFDGGFTPTPTASTPTRDELQHQQQLQQHLQQTHEIFGNLRTKRTTLNHQQQPRYDQSTIDARVQAMKEEFYAYRKRQAIKRAGIVLESAC